MVIGSVTLEARKNRFVLPSGVLLAIARHCPKAVGDRKQMCRLRTRYERRDDIHEAFLMFGCIVVGSYFL